MIFLGLVKNVAGFEFGCLGNAFGRPFGEVLPWLMEGLRLTLMCGLPQTSCVLASSSCIGVLGCRWTRRSGCWSWAPSVGRPGGRRDGGAVHHAVVRVFADMCRHAGQADIVRELIDGSVGINPGRPTSHRINRRGGWITASGWSAPRGRLTRMIGRGLVVVLRVAGESVSSDGRASPW
ncbi:DUF664 domain-containing protein [Actinomadura atramentaria]|uniref:mycothiol transferase n=1 Tax=Actinomadura atramentaria TaxID=1990 RepID=UPI003B8355BB